MNRSPAGRHAGRYRFLAAIDGALAIIVVVLVVQMWLLAACLEAYLSGRHQSALPGALLSGLLFAGSLGLYLFVRKLERRSRSAGSGHDQDRQGRSTLVAIDGCRRDS